MTFIYDILLISLHLEWQMSTLVDGLSKDAVFLTLFNTDQVDNIQTILHELYIQHVEVNKEIKVVTVCGLNNTQKILKAVSCYVKCVFELLVLGKNDLVPSVVFNNLD